LVLQDSFYALSPQEREIEIGGASTPPTQEREREILNLSCVYMCVYAAPLPPPPPTREREIEMRGRL
jgi:hypothetical protein